MFLFSKPKNKQKPKLSWHCSTISQQYHISSSDLVFPKTMNVLDRGHFGQIFQAKYKGQDVVIKTVQITDYNNNNTTRNNLDFKTSIKNFVDECELSLQLGRHKHVLHYMGVFFPEEIPGLEDGSTSFRNANVLDLPCLISKYMPKGNLLKYLDDDKLKEFTVSKALNYCLQLANGMKYLHFHKINHADLACRNLLLDSELTLKISDFGLAGKGVEYHYGFVIDRDEEQNNVVPSNAPLIDSDPHMSHDENNRRFFPIWWAAIEVHENGKITNFTDIWSFGVTAWEIFARGFRPYLTLNKLKEGYRLSRPKHCPLAVFMLLLRCWHKESKERPNFEQIEIALNNFLRNPNRFGLEDSRNNYLHDIIELPLIYHQEILCGKKTIVEFSQSKIDPVKLHYEYSSGKKYLNIPFEETYQDLKCNSGYSKVIEIDKDKDPKVDFYTFLEVSNRQPKPSNIGQDQSFSVQDSLPDSKDDIRSHTPVSSQMISNRQNNNNKKSGIIILISLLLVASLS